jgi:hypothetical protein
MDTNGNLSVFVGSGNDGYADGNGLFTSFSNPTLLAADSANNIYVWDTGNSLIRRIDQNQNVTTFAGILYREWDADGVGTNASFVSVNQMCFDSYGNLLIADSTCIRKISSTANVTTVAGSFAQVNGYTNGIGSSALFGDSIFGLCWSQGTIFVADTADNLIREITQNPVPQTVSPAKLHLNTYAGLQIIGNVGRTYQIQSSPDMSTWTTEITLVLTSTPYLWIDQTPIAGNKFYQAVMLP